MHAQKLHKTQLQCSCCKTRFNALLKRNDGFTYDFDKNGKQQNFCKICSEKRLQDARGLKDQAKGIPKYPPEKPSLEQRAVQLLTKQIMLLGIRQDIAVYRRCKTKVSVA